MISRYAFPTGADVAAPAEGCSRSECRRRCRLGEQGHSSQIARYRTGQGARQAGIRPDAEIQPGVHAAIEIDGLLYQSAVYTVTGSMNGCNVVLFEGRTLQVLAMSHRLVVEAVLSNGQTAIEFLDSLGVALE